MSDNKSTLRDRLKRNATRILGFRLHRAPGLNRIAWLAAILMVPWLMLLAYTGLSLFGVLRTFPNVFGVIHEGNATPETLTSLRWHTLGLVTLTTVFGALVTAPLAIVRLFTTERQTRTQEEGYVTQQINEAVANLSREKERTQFWRTVDYSLDGDLIEETETKDNRHAPPEGVSRDDVIYGDWQSGTVYAPNIEVRIGAILALERLARQRAEDAKDTKRRSPDGVIDHDGARDHVRIMEILCSYVRENAPATTHNDHGYGEAVKPLRIDIQTALKTLGRRTDLQIDCEGTLHLTSTKKRSKVTGKFWHGFRLDLRNTDLKGSDLVSSDTRPFNLSNADLQFVKLEFSKLDNANFERTNLERADFERARLRNTVLSCASLAYARLKHADLEGAKLDGANFIGTDFTNSNLRGAQLLGAKFIYSNLENAKLENSDIKSVCIKHASLKNTSLQGAKLSFLCLDKARLLFTSLLDVEMEHVSLKEATIFGVDLRGARLKNVDLSDAKVTSTLVHFADLRSVTGMTQSQLDGMVGNSATLLPSKLGDMSIPILFDAFETEPKNLEQLKAHLEGKREEDSIRWAIPYYSSTLEQLTEGHSARKSVGTPLEPAQDPPWGLFPTNSDEARAWVEKQKEERS